MHFTSAAGKEKGQVCISPAFPKLGHWLSLSLAQMSLDLVSFADLTMSESCHGCSVLWVAWAPRLVSLSQIKHCRQCFGHRRPLTQPHKSHSRLALSLSLSLCSLTSWALVQAIPKPRKAPGAPSVQVSSWQHWLLPLGTWAWTAVCHRYVSPQQLPPNFVTAAVSQDMATVPARKGTFYPAETGQQFKWGNVITHTSVWPSNGI